MFKPNHIHHIAIICSDYQRSLLFYTQVIGLELVSQVFRADRQSWKADLSLNQQYVIELFSFPDPPKRLSRPEAVGLRHLAFAVPNIDVAANHLDQHKITREEIRVDVFTQKRFFFFMDPDNLPIEFYEI
jgi:glyoxylase I family protein